MSGNNTNVNQEPSNATPAATEGQSGNGKMFTQDDVNRIVSERLAREREKATAEPDPMEQREKDLAAREAAMSCKEYIAEKKYPAGLLEIFDTGNAEDFKKRVDKLVELFPDIDPAQAAKTPVFTRPTSGGNIGGDPIAEAFRRK